MAEEAKRLATANQELQDKLWRNGNLTKEVERLTIDRDHWRRAAEAVTGR